MIEMRNGSIRLFTVFGITVYLHWSWFLVAVIFIGLPQFGLNSIWGVFVYLALFGIVLIHEFGHALACRSVGGKADTIVLWPLGGIAFVQPPQRPGAVLWSIAAGPLVNVVLVPITFVLMYAIVGGIPQGQASGLKYFIIAITYINLALLIFNILPIYPLDGGQILQAILWFFVGRTKSLRIASGIGLVCAVVGGAACLVYGETWLFILALFIGWQAYNGWRVAQYMAMQDKQDGDRR
ncbi:site-2 protease family protein [Poriferisphaera sp. WC338]|uniref:site-2 protease family protein n=1 Tax=Poriferisphaera sp. WC338 TaxID=3425129 RepID=UPI003D813179